MLDPLLSEYIKKVCKLQITHAEELNSFSVETRYDNYYGIYLYVSFSDDNGRYATSFLQCVDKEDYEKTYQQLVLTLNNENR